jgi:hypothetical protein
MSEFNHPQLDDDHLPRPVDTIEHRILRGRETDRAYENAIVPFPDRFGVPASCSGKVGGDYERMVAGGYRCTHYAYRGPDGEVLQYVLRFDHKTTPGTNPKVIKPILYYGKVMPLEDRVGFAMLAKPRPLYGLDRLAARPDAPVLVVEGEKTAEAASELFPDHVSITWMSGASNARHTEMLALHGRSLTLWPDNDLPGRSAMRMFAAKAFEAGAVSVRLVAVPAGFGEGWDLADAVPADSEYDVDMLLQEARPVTPSEVAYVADDARQQAEKHRLLGYKPGYSKVSKAHATMALELLDPDMYGNEWRRIARCLYYAYGADALGDFDAWSRGSKGKYRDGEPSKLFAAYAGEPAFRADALAWLFRKAQAKLRDRSTDDEAGEPNVKLDQDAFALAHIEEVSENHAVVLRAGKTGVLFERYDPRFKRFTEDYLKRKDFEDLHVRRLLPFKNEEEETSKKGKPKTIAQGKLWFDSTRRRSYEGVHFAPGENLGPRVLNTWRGFTVEPKDDPAGWSRFRDHLRDHVAGGDLAGFDYLLNWMAFSVQHLDQPVKTALILIGKKGAGKSVVTRWFGHLFGHHTFVTPRMDDATGRFNERLETTLVLGLEEAVAPGNTAADSALKHLVNSPTVRLEGKFFGTWEAPNHLRIIVTSNHEHVVRADGSDRRYAVFDVTNPHQPDPGSRLRYFGAMFEQLETGGYGAMLGELLGRNVRRWNPEDIPETPALVRQKQLSLGHHPVQSYLFERLSEGINITTGEANIGVRIYSWSETDTVYVRVQDLNADFKLYADAHGMSFSQRELAVQLPRFMPEGFASVTRRQKDGDGSGGTFKAYPFPPLEKARQRFEEVTGMSIPREV